MITIRLTYSTDAPTLACLGPYKMPRSCYRSGILILRCLRLTVCLVAVSTLNQDKPKCFMTSVIFVSIGAITSRSSPPPRMLTVIKRQSCYESARSGGKHYPRPPYPTPPHGASLLLGGGANSTRLRFLPFKSICANPGRTTLHSYH